MATMAFWPAGSSRKRRYSIERVVASGCEIPFPPLSDDLHHEVELVFAISMGGKNIGV